MWLFNFVFEAGCEIESVGDGHVHDGYEGHPAPGHRALFCLK